MCMGRFNLKTILERKKKVKLILQKKKNSSRERIQFMLNPLLLILSVSSSVILFPSAAHGKVFP